MWACHGLQVLPKDFPFRLFQSRMLQKMVFGCIAYAYHGQLMSSHVVILGSLTTPCGKVIQGSTLAGNFQKDPWLLQVFNGV